MKKGQSMAEHLAAFADTKGCWEWAGRIDKWGYGRVSYRGAFGFLAHRAAYIETNGSIPDGMTIDHLCRNRRCINPDHMEPVSNKVNILRGESWSARNARKTQCKRGHDLTPGNVYVWRNMRHCNQCRALRATVGGGA